MNCCIAFSSFRRMDKSEPNQVMRAELSKKNKVPQAKSKSLSSNIDKSENPLTDTPDYSKLPELNSDKEIEDVLCKISELLTSNSVISSSPDLNDSRTIEEILREAEEIVKDSSSYFEDADILKSSHIDGCNLDDMSDRTECSIELEQEQSKNLSSGSNVGVNDALPRENGPAEIDSGPTRPEFNDTTDNISGFKKDCVTRTNNERPLTLKDLDVPGRPTNLNLPLNVITVEPYKPYADNILTSVTKQPSRSQNDTVECSDSDSSSNAGDLSEISRSDTPLVNEVNEIESPLESNKTPVQVSEPNFIAATSVSNAVQLQESIKGDKSLAKEENLVQLGIISSTPANMNKLPSVHKQRPKSASFASDASLDTVKKIYEEKIFDLERQIRILSAKLSELEKAEEKPIEKENEADLARLALLEREVQSQEELLAAYHAKNQKLLLETSKAKKVWVEAEKRLTEKVQRLERDLKRADQLNTTEALELKEALSDAREELTRLEEDSIILKNDKRDLERRNTELSDELKKLKGELEKSRSELELARAREKDKERRANAEHSLASATLQGKLSQANSELTRKQTEMVRLNTEVTRLRGELERARLGSVVTGDPGAHSHSASHQVRQLEVALERERENTRRTLVQLESINKHNLDLVRQVKELECIIKKRSKSGGGIPWGDETSNDIQKVREAFETKTKKLEHELASKEKQLVEHQAKLNDLQNKYEKEVTNLQERIRRSSSAASVRSNSRATPATSDSQLIATIRGLKAEIASKDKQLSKLNRELDDTKKRMTRSQTNLRQTSLNNNRPHSNIVNKVSESGSSGGASLESGNSSKNYNPFLFEEDRETILFLRNENANLHEEVKRLEQDLINLHNKRIQDMSELESNHSAEVKRALRDQTARQTNSQITHMRGQLYTQQMVINHLKNQIKVLEQKNQDIDMLKAERDQLEGSLMEANKKVATLHQLSSPDSTDYHNLLEKLEWLEKRHELREAKLQTIVKELVARQQTTNVCNSSSCKDKLYNKNREICYYRAEIDKILDSLTEFKYIK